MHIFIDANIFVEFFEIASDSLDELEKLITVLESGKTTLWLPEQAKREFWNNRENHIKCHVANFEQYKAIGDVPLLVREHPKFAELSKRAKHLDELRREIAATVKSEVDSQRTHADKIIRKLFGDAKPINTDNDKIFSAAWRRALSHLPPGKNDDLGDRLVWVALLTELPNKAELHIVSDDSDYQKDGSADTIRPYLAWEWKEKKKGTVKLWGRISKFLAAHFPDADNAIAVERGILAQRLRNSGSFAETHSIIADLKELVGFNEEQLRHIAEALVENTQVRYILDDEDIHGFYEGIVDEYSSRLDKHLNTQLVHLLSDKE